MLPGAVPICYTSSWQIRGREHAGLWRGHLPEYRRDVLADEIYVHGPPAGSGRLRVALLYPSDYAVGMSNLALQGLYRLLNAHGDILCERVFYPGLRERDRKRDDTLRSLEHATALGAFDVIAITSSFELDWLKLPAAFQRGGVPLLAAERTRFAPLVIAGGPAVTANPMPLAQIADALFIGEAEPIVDALVHELLSHDPGSDSEREALLENLTQIPGFLVPTLEQSLPVPRIALDDLDAVPTTTGIISPRAEFASAFLIETGRGCPRRCRFCLARQIYHPVRRRSAESILAAARRGLEHTDRIGLVGAAVADHPQIAQITTQIVQYGGRVTTSALRAEGVSQELLEALVASGQQTITLAPETADERMAEVLGKRLDFDTVREAVELAAALDMTDVRLYFILGIPGEDDDTADAIIAWVGALEREIAGIHVTVNAGALVPKPHTPLERAAVPDPATVDRRLKRLRRGLRKHTRADVHISSARWSAVQTVLTRGDEELTPVLRRAGEGGPGDFLRALDAEALALSDYLGEQTGDLPWDVVGECREMAVNR